MASVRLLIVLLALVVAVSAMPLDHRKWQQFFCQFWSDGNTTCYNERRTKTSADDAHPSEANDPSFSMVGQGQPYKGKWSTEDGFFTLGDAKLKGPRKHVGTCDFTVGAGYTCSHAPRFSTDPVSGQMSGVGGSLFYGQNFVGYPDGGLKSALLLGTLPPQNTAYPARVAADDQI